jgi:NADH-quinone oxidoreductase subunit G
VPSDAAAPVAAQPSGKETPPPPPPDRVTLTIDGVEVEAAKGELIIEAAERAGVFIPRFCYHPRMKPVGMCRMCLVEVSSPRGPSLQPACFVQVADGQEVTTESPAARKAQEGVLEFLLLNHPLDCPVCDKGGECPLQDQAVSHGPGESRFAEEKRHWAKPIALGPLTLLDRERCIQCARCTRFAEEIAGEPLIDFFSRGDAIEVAVFPEQPFTSYFAGNTIQICPVGALTSVPYRFKSRPWDLEQVETTCTYCSVGCRIAMQSSAGKLVRFLGVDSDPVNQSWLCDRGRYGFEAVHASERLREPLVRLEGELSATSWNEALGTAAEGLRAAMEGGGVGILGGARLANEDAYSWAKLARTVLHTDHVDAQLGDGLPAELVLGLPRATVDEACSAKAVVVIAGDLHEELPVLYLRLRGAAKAGVPVVEVSPVPTPLSSLSSLVPYRPGYLPGTVRALLGETASDLPGTSPAELDGGRKILAEAVAASGEGVVVVLGRPSLAGGAEEVAAAAGLLAERLPAAKFLPALRRANVMGALDLGLAPGVLPGRVSLEAGRAWFESAWASELPHERGHGAAEMLEAAAEGRLGALVLLGSDPLADFPDRDLATRALENVPLLIALDVLPSPSVQLADIVFPTAAHGERGGTTTNLEGRVTRLAQKVVPPGTARPEWVVAAELADRLGFDLGFGSLEKIWEEIEQLSAVHRGCTMGALVLPGSHDGVVVPVATAAPVLLGKSAGARSNGVRAIDPMATPGIASVEEQGAPLFAGASVPPGTGLSEALGVLESEETGDATAKATAASRPQMMGVAAGQFAVPDSPRLDGYAVRLVTRRTLYDEGTLVQASPSLAALVPDQALRVRPKVVEQLGVADGEVVRARSPHGEIVVPLVGDESVPPGIGVLTLGVSPVDEPGAAVLLGPGQVVDLRLETVS